MTHENETVPPLRLVKDDLVARLRGRLVCYCNEAADEIERLRGALKGEDDRIRGVMETCNAHRAESLRRVEYALARAEQAEARLVAVREELCKAVDDCNWERRDKQEIVTAVRRAKRLLDGEAK